MKNETQPIPFRNRLSKLIAAISLTAFAAAPAAFAASQTWTNAPVSGSWTNVLNWVAKAVPGNINQTANNTGSGDVATFNSPIPLSGIGGASQPITPDDATNAGRSRGVSGITFDNTNCGAYVIASPTPPVLNSNGVLWVSHNGTIQMTAPVTNSQTILEPLNVFLPSSTDGRYTLMNNSTNPNAALIVSSLSWAGTSSRSVNFVLDGTNTANNVVTNLSNSTSTGAGGITKQGPGTWIIAGSGTFVAAKTINVYGGTLAVRAVDAFGLATTATVSNSVLRLDGVTLNQAALQLKTGGNIRANGSATVNGVTVGNTAAINATLSAASAADILTVGNGANKLTGGAADTILHSSGPGTVLLAFDSNYVGKWAIDSGTNQLGAGATLALGAGASTTIAAGATLDLTPLGPVTYNLSTTALGGSGTGTGASTAAKIVADAGATIDLATGTKGISLTFTPTTFSGDTTHPALYVAQGTLSLGGNAFSINNASGTALGVGTYTLISQAGGSIADGGGYSVTGVTGSGLTAGNVASIVVSGGSVNLVVSPYVAKNLVWTGGAANANWNIATDANWLNGVSPIIFNNSDNVTFNSVGLTNPTVTLVSTLAPSSVIVDAASTYTFAGSGQIAGGSSLIKKNTGTLVLNTVNTYGGGTVVSNGTIQLGANNAVSSTGSGDVSLVTPGTLDLNGFTDAINGLNGNGTVDVANGGSSTLTIGANNNGGSFSGKIQNTSGTIGIVKNGTGVQILGGSNSYSGTTVINVGTLRVTDRNALGGGNSAVTVSGGTLDLSTNVVAASIAGAAGIANNSTTTTNQLNVLGASTWAGTIADGSGGGGVSVLVSSGTLRLNAANSFSGGSIVANGAGLQIGNTGTAGAGGIIASNNSVVGMANNNNPSSGMGNTVTIVDNASLLFTGGGNQANNFFGQFIGSSTATNVLTNAFTIGSTMTFGGFNGRVIVAPSANVRIGAGSVITTGGNNAMFDFQGGNIFCRDGSTVYLGAVSGGSPNSGIGRPSVGGASTWIIGGTGQDMVFSGYINNNGTTTTNISIVKSGAGTLVLNGVNIVTNTDSANYTNYLYTDIVVPMGPTVISNGVLKLVAPITFSNTPSIRLAGAGAVLDARQMGVISETTEPFSGQPTDTLIVNGTLPLFGTQTLSGIGTIWGKLSADVGATIAPGNPTGTLTITNNVTLNTVTMNVTLNRTNTPNCGQLAAAGASTITVNGGTLTIAAAGNDLVTGDVFHIFNKASLGNFAVTNLPASNALNTISYVWTNKLAIDGTLVLVQGASAVNTTPGVITNSVSGNTLTLSWSADRIGWRLQSQTNTLSTGLNPSGTWFDVAGSTTVNTLNFTLNPNNGTVFYRMVYP